MYRMGRLDGWASALLVLLTAGAVRADYEGFKVFTVYVRSRATLQALYRLTDEVLDLEDRHKVTATHSMWCS